VKALDSKRDERYVWRRYSRRETLFRYIVYLLSVMVIVWSLDRVDIRREQRPLHRRDDAADPLVGLPRARFHLRGELADRLAASSVEHHGLLILCLSISNLK
jgi:hypothetical protein